MYPRFYKLVLIGVFIKSPSVNSYNEVSFSFLQQVLSSIRVASLYFQLH